MENASVVEKQALSSLLLTISTEEELRDEELALKEGGLHYTQCCESKDTPQSTAFFALIAMEHWELTGIARIKQIRK